jgi:hypothetical protein
MSGDPAQIGREFARRTKWLKAAAISDKDRGADFFAANAKNLFKK